MKIPGVLILITMALGCNMDQNQVDRAKIREELENRKIKKLSDSEILEAGLTTGAEMVRSAQKAMLGKMAAIAKNADSSNQWLLFPPCNEFSKFLLREFNQTTKHKVSLVSQHQFDAQSETNELELQLLDAYQHIFDKSMTVDGNVNEFGNEIMLFTIPLTSKDSICTACLLGSDYNGMTEDEIRAKPPVFCGMWAVKLSKKELIKSL